MAETKSGAGRWNGTTPRIRLAAQLDSPENSAAPGRPQLRASKLSISSFDEDDGLDVPAAVAWLAQRGRVTVHHAVALAEAHGIGGAA